MYNIHEKCFDCVIKMETKLKLEGKFEEYENKMMNNNKKSLLNELEVAIEEYSKSTNSKYYSEDGKEENWQGGSVDTDYVNKIKDWIKDTRNETP